MYSRRRGRSVDVGQAETLLRQQIGRGAEVVLCETLPRGLHLADAGQNHLFTVTANGKRVGGHEIMVVDRMTGAVRPAGRQSE